MRKPVKVKSIGKKQVLINHGYDPENLKCKPDWVLEALVQYAVSEMIDLQELEAVLWRGGYDLDQA